MKAGTMVPRGGSILPVPTATNMGRTNENGDSEMTITAGALKRGDHITAGRAYAAVVDVRHTAGGMVTVTVSGGGAARFHADEYVTIGGGAR